MKKYFKKIWAESPKVRKTTGIVLIAIGLLSVITPFTPLGFLLILGLEVSGIRALFWDKFKNWFRKKDNRQV